MSLLLVWGAFACLWSLGNSHSPRMVFKEKDAYDERLQVDYPPVKILAEEQPDVIISVGETKITFYSFKTPKNKVEKEVMWDSCKGEECNSKITVVHLRNDMLFVCGTNRRGTFCCNINNLHGNEDPNLSEQLRCETTEEMTSLRDSISEFTIKKGEHSLLVENQRSIDLYVTSSGSQNSIGIHKFGEKRVRPTNHDEEQYFVGLVLNKRRDDSLQDKVYAFYKQKNKEKKLDSDEWVSFVSQVCLGDAGGPKNHLQFSWTSQLNARLFCGRPEGKRYFPELVDVATVQAERWQDTRVYALFRNEWNMSAVCIYTLKDIEDIFTNSPFKEPEKKDDNPKNNQENEADKNRRKCVPDSTQLPAETLKRIETTSEMKQWVHPMNRAGPLLFEHHKYTHIRVDALQPGQKTVIFLSLNNGGIHKVLEDKNGSFLIAEYHPFKDKTHIQNTVFHSFSKKLYVNSREELVQINVANCEKYGTTSQDCVLSKDPHCVWTGNKCTTSVYPDVQETHFREKRVTAGPGIGKVFKPPKDEDAILVPPGCRYFLQCPVRSRHAQYTWHGPGGSSPCEGDTSCLLLIHSMGPQQEGTYRCESEENGFRKVLGEYRLKLRSSGGGLVFAPTLCFMALLLNSVV